MLNSKSLNNLFFKSVFPYTKAAITAAQKLPCSPIKNGALLSQPKLPLLFNGKAPFSTALKNFPPAVLTENMKFVVPDGNLINDRGQTLAYLLKTSELNKLVNECLIPLGVKEAYLVNLTAEVNNPPSFTIKSQGNEFPACLVPIFYLNTLGKIPGLNNTDLSNNSPQFN